MTEREAETARVLALLRAYGIESNRLARRYAAAAAVHPTDLQALELLSRDELPMTVGALGAALGLSSASMTGLVDRLEAAGHVERVRDDADRRRVRVRMTGGALDAATAHFGPWVERLHGAMDELDDEGLAVVSRFLAATVAATRDAGQDAPASDADPRPATP